MMTYMRQRIFEDRLFVIHKTVQILLVNENSSIDEN